MPSTNHESEEDDLGMADNNLLVEFHYKEMYQEPKHCTLCVYMSGYVSEL